MVSCLATPGLGGGGKDRKGRAGGLKSLEGGRRRRRRVVHTGNLYPVHKNNVIKKRKRKQ